jgi:hypothetical protein
VQQLLLHLYCVKRFLPLRPACTAAAAAAGGAAAAVVQWSLGQAGVGAAGVAMCFVWLATAHKLGQHHKQLATADSAVRDKMML